MEKYIKNKLVSKLPNLKRWYGRYDFRSWIVLGANLYRQKISLRKMREGLELYKHLTRSQKYFISLPRSGSSYIVSILNSATDISSGGTGKYFLDEETDLWTHNLRLHYPVAPNTFLKILNRYYSSPPHQNTFAVSHHPITHGFIDPHKMKVVFTLRNLHDQLKSLLYHQGFDFETQDKFIEKGYVEMMIDYFNYWGEFIKSKDKKFNRDFFYFKYEFLIEDPFYFISKIAHFWDLDISDDAIKQAIIECDKRKMIDKAKRSKVQRRVTVDNERKYFNEHNLVKINQLIDKKLNFDFGYQF